MSSFCQQTQKNNLNTQNYVVQWAEQSDLDPSISLMSRLQTSSPTSIKNDECTKAIRNISGPQNTGLKPVDKAKRGKSYIVPWSQEEDLLLYSKLIELGSKWVQIADSLPSKTDNDIKNRFYSCIRRVHKAINDYQLRVKVKPKKLITFDSLLTFIEISKFTSHDFDGRFVEVKKKMEDFLEVRQMIFDLAVKGNQDDPVGIARLVDKLSQIKYALKFINMKRVKKSGQKIPSSDVLIDPLEGGSYQLDQMGNAFLKLTNKQVDSMQILDLGEVEASIIRDSSFPSNSNTLFRECYDLLSASVMAMEDANDLFCML